MPYRTLADPAFDRTLSLRDAYRVLEQFTLAYWQVGDVPVSHFYSYLGVAPDGVSGDPAAIEEFLDAASHVLGPTPGTAAS